LITVVGTGVGTGVTIELGTDDGNSLLGMITIDGCPGTVIIVDGGDGIGEMCVVGNVDGKSVGVTITIVG
jgi:hypothetical protein